MTRSINRRDVLLAAFAAAASRVAEIPATSSAQPDGGRAHDAVRTPAAIAAAEGELVYVGRDPVRIKISPPGTSGRFAMITQEVSRGTAIPVHLHENEDELIIVQSGTGEATLGDRPVALAAGSTLYVPQGTWHGGRNTGPTPMMWIAIYSPSGFEGYFREIGRPSPDAPPQSRTPEEREVMDRRFGIRYRG